MLAQSSGSGRAGSGREWDAVYPKANLLHRCIAKFVDLLIVAALYQIPLPVSFIGGVSYLLIADGLPGGKSFGKQLIGLQVIVPLTRRRALYRESILRNFPLAVAYFLFALPYVGLGIVLVVAGFEFLLIVGNDQGLRGGDELGRTQVLDRTVFEAIEKKEGAWV